MGIWAWYALFLLHGGPPLIYMAIYGRVWLYMLIYALKYSLGCLGMYFCVSELVFRVSGLIFWVCEFVFVCLSGFVFGYCILVGCLYTCRAPVYL